MGIRVVWIATAHRIKTRRTEQQEGAANEFTSLLPWHFSAGPADLQRQEEGHAGASSDHACHMVALGEEWSRPGWTQAGPRCHGLAC